MARGAGPGAVPRWLAPTGLVLTAAGLGVSAYLAYEHYTASTTLACPDNGMISCARVTASEQSTLFHIPVALLGVGFFAVMLLAVLPAAWRITDRRLRRGRLAAAGCGVGFALYLVWAELFVIDAICTWCTVVHVLAFALFAVVAVGTALTATEA